MDKEKMKVTVVLENNELLTLRQKVRVSPTLVVLTNDYALEGSCKLYKRKSNVVCGIEVPYKRLDIHIIKK